MLNRSRSVRFCSANGQILEEWNGTITKAAAAEFAFLLRPAAPPCGYGLPYPASRDKQIPMAN